jgi:hypothetical protein
VHSSTGASLQNWISSISSSKRLAGPAPSWQLEPCPFCPTQNGQPPEVFLDPLSHRVGGSCKGRCKGRAACCCCCCCCYCWPPASACVAAHAACYSRMGQRPRHAPELLPRPTAPRSVPAAHARPTPPSSTAGLPGPGDRDGRADVRKGGAAALLAGAPQPVAAAARPGHRAGRAHRAHARLQPPGEPLRRRGPCRRPGGPSRRRTADRCRAPPAAHAQVKYMVDAWVAWGSAQRQGAAAQHGSGAAPATWQPSGRARPARS